MTIIIAHLPDFKLTKQIFERLQTAAETNLLSENKFSSGFYFTIATFPADS